MYTPKPLLKLRNKAILDYIIDKVEQLEKAPHTAHRTPYDKNALYSVHRTPYHKVNKVYIITNHKFYGQFHSWLLSKNDGYLGWIKLIDDGSTTVEDRLGAIGDIELAIANENIDDDLLVIGADNLFDFDLNEFVEFSQNKVPFHSTCLYLANNGVDLTRFGLAHLNGSQEVAAFEEKPELPRSNLIGTCIYFFPKEKLYLVSKYLKEGHNRDTAGSYIRWLIQHGKVYGNICDGTWYDLGDFDSLSHACIHFNGHKAEHINL